MPADPRTPSRGALGTPSAQAGGGTTVLAWVLLLQAALAVAFALHKSLVLDEFHTLSHASAEDLSAFVSRLKLDNHPPAGFLVLRAWRAFLPAMNAELFLRAPQILFGLGTTWFVARTAGRLGAPVGIAAALWGLSSPALEFSTQVRMYALSTLAVAGTLNAAVWMLQEPGRKRAGISFLVWSVVGLHAHYFVVHYVFLAGVVLLASLALAPARRASVRALVAWGVGALLLCLPWYLSGFLAQYATGLEPGMARTGWGVAPEAWVHLTMWNLRLAGDVFQYAFAGAGMAAVGLALAGALALARRGRGSEAWLLLVLALGTSLWASLLTFLQPRLGFNWNYVLPSAPPLAVLVAVAAGCGPWRLKAAQGVVALALCLSLLNVGEGGTEDYRGAIASVNERWRPGDAVVTVEYQSQAFPQGLAWDHYATSLQMKAGGSERAAPGRQPMGKDFDVLDPEGLATRPRIFLIRRALPESMPLVQRLRASHEETAFENWGFGLWVHVFELPGAAR